ncbi:hypothetical protein ACWDSJ_32085 [Nocardia sp. NPDC003482]
MAIGLCRTVFRGRYARDEAALLQGLAGAGLLLLATAGTAAAAQVNSEFVFLSPEQYQARWGRLAPITETIAPAPTGDRPDVTRAPLHRQGDGWAVIKWDEHDLRGVSTPVREGNDVLGFAHYAFTHNLTSGVPIHAAFQTHKPDKELGARVEYTSLAVDQKGGVRLTVRVIVQAATATDDRIYRTTDGKNIGVITAYCEGMDVCPGWVNTVR